MTNSLTGQMADASNQREALIQLVKQAVTDILALEEVPYRDSEQDQKLDDSVDHLLEGIRTLRVVDVSPSAKRIFEHSTQIELADALMETLDDRTDLKTSSLAEKIVDYLALASIYEEAEPAKARSLNELAHLHLGEFQNHYTRPILSALKEVVGYYPTPGQPTDDFQLTDNQRQAIDHIIAATTERYIAGNKKDHATTEDLVNLALEIEDDIVSTDLTRALFDHRSPANQIRYIEGMVDDAYRHAADDAEVENPIIARFGRTYAAVRAAIEKADGKVSNLLTASTSTGQQPPHLG